MIDLQGTAQTLSNSLLSQHPGGPLHETGR